MTVAQGTAIHRAGRVRYVRGAADPAQVLIGGAVNVLIDGQVTL